VFHVKHDELSVTIFKHSKGMLPYFEVEYAEFMRWRDAIWEKYQDTQRYIPPYREPRRARRIRDKQRMKRRARWVAKTIWSYRQEDLRGAEKNADHIAACSCWMCGHQRSGHGPAMQEQREQLRADTDLLACCVGQYWRRCST